MTRRTSGRWACRWSIVAEVDVTISSEAVSIPMAARRLT